MTKRNDPCHCGSGTKYKKCCLTKDKEPKPEPEPSEQPTKSRRALRRAVSQMALFGAMAQEPRPTRNRGKEGFFDELRRQGHTEEEIKQARSILDQRIRPR